MRSLDGFRGGATEGRQEKHVYLNSGLGVDVVIQVYPTLCYDNGHYAVSILAAALGLLEVTVLLRHFHLDALSLGRPASPSTYTQSHAHGAAICLNPFLRRPVSKRILCTRT